MNASLATRSMDVPASGAATEPSKLDAKLARELEALWRSVFERARDVELRADSTGAGVQSMPTFGEPASATFTHPIPAAAIEDFRAAEAVSVFVSGRTISVNVRDAGLAADEALRCAFETARTLTGERASLQTLTLNGRAVYRQASRSESPDSPSLIFAC